MNSKTILIMLVCGSFFLSFASCSNEKDGASPKNGIVMDSATTAEQARDELKLSTLKEKKIAAEKQAIKAMAETKKAKRLERDAADAAEQADEAFRAEEEAQRSRQQANDQAKKADEASDKAGQN